MVRPALSAALWLLAGCAAAPSPAVHRVEPGRDLAPSGASARGGETRTVGDQREAVVALAAGYRDALLTRDVVRLRAVLAPALGGMQQSDLAMSREAWLSLGDALFSAASAARERLTTDPTLAPFGACAGRCPVMLGPGEWLVVWAEVPRPRGLGVFRGVTQVLPTALRVRVVDGAAAVVGMDDAVVLSHGPARFSGLHQP